MTADLTLQGSLAIAGGGVLIILSGVAMIRDWLHIGTLLASYNAVLSSPFGPKYFNRVWKRRGRTRKIYGWFAIFIGTCWLIGGLDSAFS